MTYYSTNHKAPKAALNEAVVQGLACDGGLFMPGKIERMPKAFFDDIDKMTFQQVSLAVAEAFFGEDIPLEDLKAIVDDALPFDCPLTEVSEHVYALELFHGPTLAFKDVGARFMARLLGYFNKHESRRVNVLVATSGDTGSAVANGFLGVKGIHVYVLYPKGRVSAIQECQFTTLGRNITAIEVDGTFDDCQALVKRAFLDRELNASLVLTSANSINVARLLPQTFYYFYAYSQLKRLGRDSEIVVCVPSGNFGNITAALFAHRMGLPVKRFIAANNANDVVLQYLNTGIYTPRPSVPTIANAMDVGNPSNFARILQLFDHDHAKIKSLISGASYQDADIRQAIQSCYRDNGYMLDPHGACAYLALTEGLKPGETGIFCETAHPAKFKDTVDPILNELGAEGITIPQRLLEFMQADKQTVELSSDFDALKHYLMDNASTTDCE